MWFSLKCEDGEKIATQTFIETVNDIWEWDPKPSLILCDENGKVIKSYPTKKVKT